ncbi:transglutaminase family protein [Clostridium sp. CF012]|uniref:transglutaminase-like domain-containing protein n=1 Tax=Clostridium sp. CF012 TaxID=2843319 RepID=UPI001C0E2E4B|nr:transglutaminase-like domain-containing protein [Clostridium sp. CF012]MBU3146382.1 transglutaminase-like domain-containing protein [Clostridium sp. CF012]
MKNYLKETHLLDYNHPKIQQLMAERKWSEKDEFEKIKQIYCFVKNEIVFGYNSKDDFKSSEILNQGYGQCNTKATLLMSLLRGVGVPTRTHGFMIDKTMQKGALVGLTYLIAPAKIIHIWVEVYHNGNWIALEGVIPDDSFYNAIKDKLKKRDDGYYGYAIAIKEKSSNNLCFTGKDTYSQSLAITDDLGIYDSPELFFEKYNNTLTPIKEFLFEKILSKMLNRRLQKIRNAK